MEQSVAKDSTMRLWVTGNSNSRYDVTKSAEKDPFGLRNLPVDATAANPKQYDVLYTNMAPVLQLLRAMGALPIRTLPVDGNASSGN
jgi:hypothetical protein